jgi:hypothetical protein
MKTYVRKAIFATAIALAATVATTPAHATLSGSNPRPTSGGVSASAYLSIMLSVLGY